jgi:hypothetical protein
MGTRVSLCNHHLIRCLILVHIVYRNDLLHHAKARLRNIGRLIWEELSLSATARIRRRILRRQIERDNVHKHKVPPAERIQLVDGLVHAIDVVDERFALDLRVGEKGGVADVIRADPDGVDGCVDGQREEGLTVGLLVGGVSFEGRNLVFLDGGEWNVEGAGKEGSRANGVAADGAADGVVVEVAAGVEGDVAGPDVAAI